MVDRQLVLVPVLAFMILSLILFGTHFGVRLPITVMDGTDGIDGDLPIGEIILSSSIITKPVATVPSEEEQHLQEAQE